MTATVLDGKKIATEIQLEIRDDVSRFTEKTGITPCLAAVLVGEDPASQVYVRNKRKACELVGIESIFHHLPTDTSESDLLKLIDELNKDAKVHGILVQLPLPDSIDPLQVLDAIDALKDVDAFHPENVGLISQGRPRFLPCTPHGIMQILHRYDITVSGKHVVVVGRSDIVGKPMAMMLLARDSTTGPDGANATVTVCHSRTPDLAAITKTADVLIAAIGQAKFIAPDMVKPGAVVVDVGINRTDDGLVGDVDYESVAEVASAITPVPGGVGRLTVTMLLYNTLKAAELQNQGS
ncbi:MAG: methylenetetrahydrofolate dehydrogenase (NADP+)/methenyltetrahydrofolate cyclohydrolase [Pirellulaceae bacterium]|jgi:methylenetetrahydrofolate dehydrogenase (NADP+)/methenyltetrahydrofolate cyclohydrolase